MSFTHCNVDEKLCYKIISEIAVHFYFSGVSAFIKDKTDSVYVSIFYNFCTFKIKVTFKFVFLFLRKRESGGRGVRCVETGEFFDHTPYAIHFHKSLSLSLLVLSHFYHF